GEGRGIPVFALCVVVAFLVQWAAFVPAFLLQTEKFYDLTGSLTYLTVTGLALTLGPVPDAGALLLGMMVAIWATRLGTFLFRRALREGGDRRFDEIKPSFVRFLNTWTLQGLWVTITAAAALAAITSLEQPDLGPWAVLGVLVWGFGFLFEVVADHQKAEFRADPANEGEFIRSGLWSLSRHPNYFGEIVLWAGVALTAFPALQGWQHATLLSPLFVYLLLTRVSGIPMLEEKADERWSGREDYERYKEETPVLVPGPGGG
ncbi:MAG: DUF1295 domain-containing protein, partial [Gemmatimonadota bacterium]